MSNIVRSGDEQAVQLPPEFQFDGSAVQIRSDGDAVILESIDDEWGWLEDIAVKLDSAVLDAILEATDEEMSQQDRPALDDL